VRFQALVLALGCSVSAGCGATLGGEGAATSTSSSSPEVVVDVPVSSAPPPDRTDPPRPRAPGFGYIWVAGHWDNLDGAFIWKDGHWQQGRRDYEYIRARYEFDSAKRIWIYHRPHWKLRHAVAAVAAPAPTTSIAPPVADGGAP
jgi:hypothetical protein